MPTTLAANKSLDPANQYSFVCPVFNAETKIAACFVLRDLVWRGDKPGTRRGCQVAMHAGKCPINDIIKQMGRTDEDPYYSATPKVGALKDNILDRIAPVLVPEQAIEKANLPLVEAKMLHLCNEIARDPTKRRAKVKQQPRRDPTKAEMAAMEPLKMTNGDPVSRPRSAAIDAAKSGDMTAAVNAEIKDTGAKS